MCCGASFPSLADFHAKTRAKHRLCPVKFTPFPAPNLHHQSSVPSRRSHPPRPHHPQPSPSGCPFACFCLYSSINTCSLTFCTNFTTTTVTGAPGNLRDLVWSRSDLLRQQTHICPYFKATPRQITGKYLPALLWQPYIVPCCSGLDKNPRVVRASAPSCPQVFGLHWSNFLWNADENDEHSNYSVLFTFPPFHPSLLLFSNIMPPVSGP